MMSASVVLVVDDNALLRMEASDLLKDAGYDVLEAADAAEAIAILETRPGVSLLFTDVDMPGGADGISLATEVHNRWPEICLLVTSGGVTVKDEDLPDDGRFVPKPYGGETLTSLVREQIEKGH